jgi:hypothetical protein
MDSAPSSVSELVAIEVVLLSSARLGICSSPILACRCASSYSDNFPCSEVVRDGSLTSTSSTGTSVINLSSFGSGLKLSSSLNPRYDSGDVNDRNIPIPARELASRSFAFRNSRSSFAFTCSPRSRNSDFSRSFIPPSRTRAKTSDSLTS